MPKHHMSIAGDACTEGLPRPSGPSTSCTHRCLEILGFRGFFSGIFIA